MRHGMRAFAILFALCLVGLVPSSETNGADDRRLENLQAQIRDNTTPVLRLNIGGPSSLVTAMAFSADGHSLYAGGWDKVVHVWERRDDGQYESKQDKAFRIPVGPDEHGKINAIAVSPDDRWLGVAGVGLIRESAGFSDPQNGLILPNEAVTDEQWLDYGTIYIFDRVQGDLKHVIRGCRGRIEAIHFVDAPAFRKQPWLVVAARESTRRRVYLIETETEELRSKELPKSSDSIAPNLATWQPQQPTSLRVGITWGDGFRQWQPFADVLDATTYASCYTCLHVPSRDRVAVGKLGQIVLYDRVGVERKGVLSDVIGDRAAPRAMASLGKDREHLALVVLRVGADGRREYSLMIVRSTDWQVVRDDPVAEGLPPQVATSSSGNTLAAFDNRTSKLLIYSETDLIRRDRKPRPQILALPAKEFRSVAFGRLDDRLALLLGHTSDGPDEPNRLILDLSKGALSTDKGWRAVAPKLDGWHVELTGRSHIRVRRPDGRSAVIDLPPPQTVDDLVLCPSAKPVPLLAVAGNRLGEPHVDIYNANDGEWLRRLRGPLERVHALAFSEHGRLVAATSKDRQLRVWSLADLPRVLGQHSLIRGLRVGINASNKLVVKEIDTIRFPAAKARLQALRVGDVVESVEIADQSHTFVGARGFYRSIAEQNAGDQITLHISRDGRRIPIKLQLGHAVDSCNPLFSIFFNQAERTGRWSWIAWTPLGVYTSSDRQVEDAVGWHFNMPDPRLPVRFASLNKYPKLYRESLLQRLLENQVAPLQPPPSTPEISLHFLHDGNPLQPDDESRVFLPPDENVTAAVVVSGIPATEVASVRLVHDDDRGMEFLRSNRNPEVWEHSFRQQERRKAESLIFLVQTRGSYPQTYRLESGLSVLVQPRPTVRQVLPALPADRLTPTSPPQVLQVEGPRDPGDRPTCSLTCRVNSETKPVAVHLAGSFGEQSRATDFQPVEDDVWEAVIANVPLQSGRNEISIQVENVAGTSPPGTAIVQRQKPPPMASPPVVALESEREVISRARVFAIAGLITSPAPLKEVQYTFNGQDHILTADDATREKEGWAFDIKLDLLPDRTNTFSIVARDELGQASQPQHTSINFVPPPLRIEIASLSEQDHQESVTPVLTTDRIFVVSSTVRASRVHFKGALHWDSEAAPQSPLFMKVWVNGFLQAGAVELLEPVAGSSQLPFKATVTLNRAKDNRIYFELPLDSYPSYAAQVRIDRCDNPNSDLKLHVLVFNVGTESADVLRRQIAIFDQVDVRYLASERALNPYAMVQQLAAYNALLTASSSSNHALLMYFHGRVVEVANHEFALMARSDTAKVTNDTALTSRRLEKYLSGSGAHLIFLDAISGKPDVQQGEWQTHSRLGVVRATWPDATAVPLEDRIISQIGQTFRSDTPPTTFAGLSQDLQELYARRGSRVQFDTHIPPTGIALLAFPKQ